MILYDNPSETVIEDSPWVLGLVLVFFACVGVAGIVVGLRDGETILAVFGGLGFLACLWVMRLGIRRVRLTLGPDEAVLTIRDFKGLTQRRFSRQNLRAGLASDEGTHRVILLVDGKGAPERIPLTRYLSSGDGHAAAVKRINAWSAAA